MEPDPISLLSDANATPADQIAALRYLKNDVVGDVQTKKRWVQRGVLSPIIQIVTRGTSENAAKLHSLQLLASFANAGPAFLSPLHASGTLSAATSSSCLQNAHPDIVTATLRLLQVIMETAKLASPASPITTSSLADELLTGDPLESFSNIILQPASCPGSEAQMSIVACLVRNLCQEEHHQSALINSGILDALATKLASFAAAEGQVLPRAELLPLSECIPEPATSASQMDEVLGAIAAIITDSPYRACKLIYSPSILAIFPNVDENSSRYSKISPEIVQLPGLRPTNQKQFQYMDRLLPDAPMQSHLHAKHAAFPPLGAPVSRGNYTANGRPSSKLRASHVSWAPPEETFLQESESEATEAESPLVPWLIHLVRTRSGNEMLMAASVLTCVFKAGFAYKMRETTVGLLVVPVLLGMLNEVDAMVPETITNRVSREIASRFRLVEETPAVLAQLITDSEVLQKAAFDCNAVKTLGNLLKKSYETPFPPASTRPWSPNDAQREVGENLTPECQLGDEGQHYQLVHRIKTRRNTLKALGALATFEQEYRKAIVDQELIQYIVDSLDQTPQASKSSEKSSDDSVAKDNRPTLQNPVSVVIAACDALRMLSRSVGILRTALIDHEVWKPLFRLLRHPEVDVQIAATALICNLVPDFSPMRGSLVDAGILKVLCEHAHSTNSSLRLNALWALKHLVDFASTELKKRCVEELASGWLVQLICDDTEDEALFSARARGDRHSSQGVLDDLDEDMDMGLAEDPRPWLSVTPPASRSQGDLPILQQAETRLSALREAELNPIRKARHDDLAIQEQGLGFIRNLIGGAHGSDSVESANETTEMIDYLFNTLGQDRLFEILASKLRTKTLHPFSRRGAGGSETRVLPPQTKIIEAVIYILVHIAASIPQHRQLVIAQTDLLKQMAKLFNSQDTQVRVALCHLINNLTWQDDGNDKNACQQRATELRKLGFLAKLETLGQSDDELDVRERAKTALWQMKHGN
ncbi:armadillo repeat protein [Xylariaceae sp. FL0804]|nr:armadillo repeat protein [Xylariaceae sp. FL0804]